MSGAPRQKYSEVDAAVNLPGPEFAEGRVERPRRSRTRVERVSIAPKTAPPRPERPAASRVEDPRPSPLIEAPNPAGLSAGFSKVDDNTIQVAPGKTVTRIELDFKPRPHQRALHAKRRRFTVCVWHRRAGKTVAAIMELIFGAISDRRPNARYGYVAPFLKQAKEVAWGYLTHYARQIPGVKIREGALSVVFGNGAVVSLYGADNPDALRGLRFDGVVLDEVADMRPQTWGEVIRPAVSDVGREGWVVFIGTPHGLNLFAELFYAALDDGSGQWCADLRRAEDTGAVSPNELAAARRDMTEAQFKQEFECDFGASDDDVLVPIEDVRAAMSRVVLRRQVDYAPKLLGVDVARFGDDKSVIFPRQGLAAFKPLILSGLDTIELADQVERAVGRFGADAVFVDVTGVGAGVFDALAHRGVRNLMPVEFGSKAADPRYLNKRAEIWFRLKEWVCSGSLPNDPLVLRDLAAPRYHFDDAGRYVLEAKDELKKRLRFSPDRGDALACTFAAGVGKGGARSGHALTDYDPYGDEEKRRG